MAVLFCLDGLDLDGIGVAGEAVDGAAGHNDVVTFLKVQCFLGGLFCKVEHHIHTGELLCHDRRNAPALTEDLWPWSASLSLSNVDACVHC